MLVPFFLLLLLRLLLRLLRLLLLDGIPTVHCDERIGNFSVVQYPALSAISRAAVTAVLSAASSMLAAPHILRMSIYYPQVPGTSMEFYFPSMFGQMRLESVTKRTRGPLEGHRLGSPVGKCR